MEIVVFRLFFAFVVTSAIFAAMSAVAYLLVFDELVDKAIEISRKHKLEASRLCCKVAVVCCIVIVSLPLGFNLWCALKTFEKHTVKFEI